MFKDVGHSVSIGVGLSLTEQLKAEGEDLGDFLLGATGKAKMSQPSTLARLAAARLRASVSMSSIERSLMPLTRASSTI